MFQRSESMLLGTGLFKGSSHASERLQDAYFM